MLEALPLPDWRIYIAPPQAGTILHYAKGRLNAQDRTAYAEAVALVEQNTHIHVHRATQILQAAGFDVSLL